MIHLIIGAIIGLIAGGVVAVAVSSTVKTAIAAWLQAHGLERSALMDAVVELDRVGSGVRVKYHLTTATTGRVEVTSEETLSIDDIDVPEVRAALLSTGHARFSALPYLDH